MVPYFLAIAIKELFPKAQVRQIVSTKRCFFCDVDFPGTFSVEVMNHLEERMREWVRKEPEIQEMCMLPSNAAEMLMHHGEKELGEQVRGRRGEVNLIKIDRFYFEVGDQVVTMPCFKLICFWERKDRIRIIGVQAEEKGQLKERAQEIKKVEDVERLLEAGGYVSWLEGQRVWEPKAVVWMEKLRMKVLEVYAGFDQVVISGCQKKTLIAWIQGRKGGGVRFEGGIDKGWAAGDKNSYLQLITKFLTILSFEYEKVGTDFYVLDPLGQRWLMSRLEWDKKNNLVEMTLCLSPERCFSLLVQNRGLEKLES